MGERIHTLSKFNGTVGKLHNDRGSVLEMSGKSGAFAAYELLLGALSHCLWATYYSIAQKMKLQYGEVDLDITGIKRDEKVATLETVDIIVTASDIEDRDKFEKAFEIATRYCSTYQTINQVAKMNWSVKYR
jgi:putative redox protein